MSYPTDRKYSHDHEWAAEEGDVVVVGITDYAQHTLGDIVFVELPEVGATIKAGESFGEVESVKSVSELVAPVSGEVVEINATLEDAPETVNADPHGAGWLIKVKPEADLASSNLLDASDYEKSIGA